MEIPALENHLQPVAAEYLDLLLRHDKGGAMKLVLNLAEAGTAMEDIYLNIFQASQHEIGRLWQINQVSVAQEHYCTAATMLFMNMLYPRFVNPDRNGHRVLVTCLGGELHELGARMVADFFEMKGWSTVFLGANTPWAEVLKASTVHRAELVAVSVTIGANIGEARTLVDAIRKSDETDRPKVLLGGHAFLESPNLWKELQGDGYAVNAREGIRTAEELVAVR